MARDRSRSRSRPATPSRGRRGLSLSPLARARKYAHGSSRLRAGIESLSKLFPKSPPSTPRLSSANPIPLAPQRHTQQPALPVAAPAPAAPSPIIPPHLRCQACNLTFKNKGLVTKHKKAVHGLELPYECLTCLKTFGDKSTALRHLDFVHKQLRKWECLVEGCTKAYKERRDLVRHTRNNHNANAENGVVTA